jgi:biotin carboxylase
LPPKLEIRGHAIECRINAEHPVKFTPSAGKITAFNVPGGNGVRVDTAQYAESVVPPYYDSLIAKLVVHGRDRAEAIAKMERALSQFVVEGIDTSISLHHGEGPGQEGRDQTSLIESEDGFEMNRKGWNLLTRLQPFLFLQIMHPMGSGGFR